MANPDPDRQKYAFSEEEIHDIIDQIPGRSVLHKLWGSISILIYVFCSAGVTKEVLIKIIGVVYDALSPGIGSVPDLSNDYNEVLLQSAVRLGTKDGEISQEHFFDSSKGISADDFE